MPALPQTLYQDLIKFFEPHFRRADERDTILLPVLSLWDGFPTIEWHGSSRTFVTRLLYRLPHSHLLTVIRELDDNVGVLQQQTIDALVERINASQGILSNAPNEPNNLHIYHKRLAEKLCAPGYLLDTRFVKLTLQIEKGVDERTHFALDAQKQVAYDDLETLLQEINERVAVLLGGPGSGKSTLLRHLQLQHAWRELENPKGNVAFFVPLNAYRIKEDGTLPSPRSWLAAQWQQQTRRLELPTFETLFAQGRMLLLLDGVNEMPHHNRADYRQRIERWQQYLQTAHQDGNTIVFSCRNLDYSASLGSTAVPIKQIQVEPLSPQQTEAFLQAYLPETGDDVWRNIRENGKLAELFTTPFYARLLVDQVVEDGSIPHGAAAMITNSVRQALHREVLQSNNRLFRPNALLTQRDYEQAFRNHWGIYTHTLPERGILIPKLARLAFDMQDSVIAHEGQQVRVTEETAQKLLNHPQAALLIAAGIQLNILHLDEESETVTFHHQLVQEYFAARILARTLDLERVRTVWHVADVSPSLEETVATLKGGAPLPALPSTGWEETTLLAAAMTADPDKFVRDLMSVNLPLAGRCVAATDVQVNTTTVEMIQSALLTRLEDPDADLRARMAAAAELGKVGDPRWTHHTGPFGDYLLPPFVEIPGGDYTIGDDEGQFENQKPAHTVSIAPFEIAAYPVTNAEYALFMAAGGYEDEQWWQTGAARAWLHGETGTQLFKEFWQKVRNHLLTKMTEESIQKHPYWSPYQIEYNLWIRDLTIQEFDELLNQEHPQDKRLLREPNGWNENSYNLPNQPVVGISWYEAQAYCAWLSAQSGLATTLPTEVEWEAAAAGTTRRRFAFGDTYNLTRCQTSDSHIERTMCVGIYPSGRTPNGIHDLSGNVLEWTSSCFRRYPYQANDGRETTNNTNARRTMRGGSGYHTHIWACTASRTDFDPRARSLFGGFRVCGRHSH